MSDLKDLPRFWSKVDVSAGPEACWPWIASKFRDGYGQFKIANVNCRAHIVAIELATDEAAKGRLCLHSCDNPACCNPKHLFWGTHQINSDDCVAKGRKARGERIAASKLSWEQVCTIRARHVRWSKTDGTFALAKEYGVNKNTIDRIVNNHVWEGN